MAEPLKEIYNASFLNLLAKKLLKVESSYDASHLQKLPNSKEWKELELKERMRATTLYLEKGFKSSLPYKEKIKSLSKACPHFSGLQGMVFPDYVEVFGAGDWEYSMQALYEFTRYSTSEFAVRPYLLERQSEGMELLLKWSKDSNEHVRRLSSEGCRPLLPWSFHLNFLRENPGPIFQILENLCCDESEYVTRSMANNLNDISKDHPELAKKWAKKFLEFGASRKTVRHGLRTLLKKDDLQALKLIGVSPIKLSGPSFKLQNKDLLIGESLQFNFSFTLKKKSFLRISYALTFKHKKEGSWHRKVFHLKEKEYAKGEHQIEKAHSFKPISTRKFYPGLHRIEIIVNGKPLLEEAFCLSEGKESWILYMAKSSKGTLYTGITNNLTRRERQHRGEIKGGSKYLRAQSFESFVYFEVVGSKSEALKREAEIKKLNKDQKWKMVYSSSISPS